MRDVWPTTVLPYFVVCGSPSGGTNEAPAEAATSRAKRSQPDLANRLAVSLQTVKPSSGRNYEPSLSLAFKIARIFALRVGDVFELDQEARS